VLTTKATRLHNLLFRQLDGVNTVARGVYLALLSLPRQSSAVGRLQMLNMLHPRRAYSILVNVYCPYEIQTGIYLNMRHALGD